MSKKWELNRRTFLRGMGTMIALPTLEAMLPSMARAQIVNPKRLMVIYRPMGNYQPGTNDLPTDAYAKVQTADVKSFVNIISRVHNQYGRDLDDLVVNGVEVGQGEHGSGIACLFSGQLPDYDPATVVSQKVWKMRTTFDQVIAAKYALNSVEANISTASTIHPRWLNRYVNTISWKGPDASLNPYTNPADIFRLLFGASNPAPTTPEQLKLQRQKSILDNVLLDINNYMNKLGQTDKTRVDQYLTSIRDLERRIASLSGAPTAGQCNTSTINAPNITTLNQSEYPTRLAIMQDLAVKAFECNRTQIFNILLAGDGDGVNFATFAGSGVTGDGNWHSISHHAESSDYPTKFKTAVAWQYEQYKQLLLKLNAVKEADGTSLLYNSAVLMMSSISDGQTHRMTDINCVLAGNLGGALKTGQLVEYQAGLAKNPPAANIFLTLMRAFGMTDTSFGNSTGVISQILA